VNMSAISIRQPWAWTILLAGKDVENRSWMTRYRGPVLIHAGKHFRPKDVRDDVRECARIAKAAGHVLPGTLTMGDLKSQTGGIVGMITVVGCIRDYRSPWAIPGEWHWQLAGARPLPFHPCKGRLGIFKVEYPFSLAGRGEE